MRTIILFLLLVTVSGCAHWIKGPKGGEYWNSLNNAMDPDWGYYEEVRQHYVETHPNVDPKIKQAILDQKIMIGMTEEQVVASWGFSYRMPRKNRTITAGGVREQWVLGRYSGYLYFENGILTTIQQ